MCLVKGISSRVGIGLRVWARLRLVFFLHLQEALRGVEEGFGVAEARSQGGELIGVACLGEVSEALSRAAQSHPEAAVLGVQKGERSKDRFGVAEIFGLVEVVPERIERLDAGVVDGGDLFGGGTVFEGLPKGEQGLGGKYGFRHGISPFVCGNQRPVRMARIVEALS